MESSEIEDCKGRGKFMPWSENACDVQAIGPFTSSLLRGQTSYTILKAKIGLQDTHLLG